MINYMNVTFWNWHSFVVGVHLPDALQLVLQRRDLVLDRSKRQRHMIREWLRTVEDRRRLVRVGLQLRRVVDRISKRQDGEPGPLVEVAAVLSGVVQRGNVQARLFRGDRDGPVQNDLKEGLTVKEKII